MNRTSRVIIIRRELKSGACLSAQQWSKRFGVSVRTLLRDFAYLRREWGEEVFYDPKLGGYRISVPNPKPMPEEKISKWARLLTLIHRICAEPGRTAKELAEETGRVERTIFRDLKELEAAGFPIFNHNGYRFAADSFLPNLHLTPEELFSLFVAVRLLESQDEHELGATGRSALEKLVRGTSENRRPDLGTLRDSVHVREVAEETGASLLERMQQGLSEGMQLTLGYRGMKDDDSKPRVVDPLGLFCFRQAWYLHAFDHDRNGLRNFRLSRITDVTRNSTPVLHESRMEIDRISYHRWVKEGQPKSSVELKVTDSLARWLEENPAHPDQRIVGDRVHYEVTDLEAVARWAASLYGLEVLAPVELRTRMSQIGTDLINRYGQA